MQLGKLSENSIILSEPISKNTAPAIALSIKYLIENNKGEETVLVVPSDLLIEDNEKFIQTIQEAQKYVDEGKIVTFGIKPTYPETGFGYICCENNIVTKFSEKPDTQTAQDY